MAILSLPLHHVNSSFQLSNQAYVSQEKQEKEVTHQDQEEQEIELMSLDYKPKNYQLLNDYSHSNIDAPKPTQPTLKYLTKRDIWLLSQWKKRNYIPTAFTELKTALQSFIESNQLATELTCQDSFHRRCLYLLVRFYGLSIQPNTKFTLTRTNTTRIVSFE